MIVIFLFCLLSVAFSLGFAGCTNGDEVYEYPSLRSEFVTLCSPCGEEHISHLLTDEGVLLPIISGDTLVNPGEEVEFRDRAICSYAFGTDKYGHSGVFLYAIERIKTLTPIVDMVGDTHFKIDPLDLQSIWRGGDSYLNLILLVKGQQGEHSFQVRQDSLECKTRGRILHLTLGHDRKGDVEAYTQKVCLSVSLSDYLHQCSEGDSISMHIYTPDGWRVWTRAF